jgi:hypothetical protein
MTKYKTMKNYQLWEKTAEGWVVIAGKGKRRNKVHGSSKFYYIIHDKRYETVRDAVDELGYTPARIRYLCAADKFTDCRQVERNK